MTHILFRPAEVAFDPSQLGVVEPEIMPYFMDDGGPDFFPNFCFRLGKSFDRLLEDEDNVRGQVAVIGAAVLEGNPVIKAEKIPRRPEFHVGDDLRGGKILDEHGDILETIPEIIGETVDRLGDEPLKFLPGQTDHDLSSIIWESGDRVNSSGFRNLSPKLI
jgi:hypothetical protein